MSERVVWLRRLGLTVVLLTFLLMVLGSWVKANGAGLACPDWPACYGKWLPPFPSQENGGVHEGRPVAYTQAQILYEWGHRAVASLLGIPMLAFAAVAATGRGLHPLLRWLPAAGVAVLALQAGIGGGTVLAGNPAWLTTLHLATATLFLVLQVVAACFAFLRPDAGGAVGRRGAAPAPSASSTPPARPPFGYVYPGEEGGKEGAQGAPMPFPGEGHGR